jgi:hypothetical protein
VRCRYAFFLSKKVDWAVRDYDIIAEGDRILSGIICRACSVPTVEQLLCISRLRVHMNTLRSKRGVSLVDMMVTVFLLATAGVIFAASFPTGYACSRKAQEYKLATAIAQRKMEQLRATNYESLTQLLMQSAGTIDAEPTDSPYSFTSVDSVAGQLTQGTGTVEIADMTSSLRQVAVTVSWQDKNSVTRSVRLTTVFADRRTRRVT